MPADEAKGLLATPGFKKARLFHVRAAAERLVRLLSDPEPWRVHNPDASPDDYFCCAGDGAECGCKGITMREETEHRRAGYPPLLSVKLEERAVEYGRWESPERSS